jgi:hypothetical protein
MQTMLERVPRPLAATQSRHRDVSLADALDRILHRGVSLEGVLTIGLADIDLLYLDLRLLLGSVDTIWAEGVPATAPIFPTPPAPSSPPVPLPATAPAPTPVVPRQARPNEGARESERGPPTVAGQGRGAEGSSTAHGLVRLVLTVVKLLHDVLERQAVRRMEVGRLSEAEIDRLGAALFAQADEISRLQRQFGFSDKDLSLDLTIPYGVE